MLATHDDVVRSYVGDLIAVLDHVSQAVAIHAKDNKLMQIANAGEVVENMNAVLTRHKTDLEAHGKSMGGTTAGGMLKDVLTSVTGALAGVYGKVRGETASRMLRDDYTAMSFVSICTTMLHTTALALNDSDTAELTLQHMQQYPRIIMSLSELLPHAVVADLQADKVPISNFGAAERAVEHLNDSWRKTS